MFDTVNDEALLEKAIDFRLKNEADNRERWLQQKRLDDFRKANQARGEAFQELLCSLDPLDRPPSTVDFEALCERVILRLAEALVALRKADLLKNLERVDETAMLANYRERGVDPEESQIAYEYGKRIIKTDPNDRHRLSQLVKTAIKEPGLRRALNWLAILLNGLAGDQLLIETKQEDANPFSEGPHEGIAATERLGKQPQLKNYAIAIEHHGAWHVFKRYKQKWRHQGKATGIKEGRQEELLECFAEGSGLLTDNSAVKSVRRTYSQDDKKRIMKILKPQISRLRGIIRLNLHIKDRSVDPLPRDKGNGAWRARIQIGLAVKSDDGSLEFKLPEKLSREEVLDV
jgi:hypothetical protein